MQSTAQIGVTNGTTAQITSAHRLPTAGLAPAFSDPLWIDLDEFRIDDGDPALTFESRLARENSWSLAFARRVVNEYKRFVYLAMRAGHAVTPSEEVDEAWHMHLTYTRSYWDHLCGEVLFKPLHHGPTRGGEAEDKKFVDWYSRTLQSYAKHFGEQPPEDIWPAAGKRFDPRSRSVKVNLADNVVIPRARIRRLGRTGLAVASMLGLTAVGGCGVMLARTLGTSQGSQPVAVVAIVIVVAILILLASMLSRRPHGGKRGWGDGPTSSCSSDSTSSTHSPFWGIFGDGSDSSHHSGHGHGHGHGHSHDGGSHSGHDAGGHGCGHGGDSGGGSSGCGSSSGCGASSGCGSSGCGGGGCGGGGCGGGGD